MDIFDMALTLTPGLGGVTAAKLIERYFCAERVFSLSYDRLVEECKLSDRVATAITTRVAFKDAELELEYCKRNGIEAIARVDPGYPTLLRDIRNPPHVIFVKGDRSLLTRNLISMVGTRTADEYGYRACTQIVEDIAKSIHNPVIVSGLAFGADSYAHRAALDNDIPTIAVLPCPLPDVTPPAHRNLANEILEKGGALISEMYSGQNGARSAYISRNRIIAGMSQGTILIQSDTKGGAMQTMEIVLEMKRQGMAIPGRISDLMSRGCNRLIGLGDATSVSSAEDIIRALGWKERRRVGSNDIVMSGVDRAAAEFDVSALSDVQLSLLRSMLSDEPLHVSALEKMNPMAVHKFNGLLIELELLGMIRSVPGALYQRIVPMEVLK